MDSDWEKWMALALKEAQLAAAKGEVPVGALVLCQDELVARAHNLKESHHDPLAHAEILALRQASQKLNRWRLFDCTLVVNLEPCPMCAGAIVNSRIERLVFGAADYRTGAAGSIMNIVQDERLNHRAEIVEGVLAKQSSAIMSDFFAARRKLKKKKR